MLKIWKVSDASNSTESLTHSEATHDADHALTEIRTWHQRLIARGNRLRELATREREDLAIRSRSDHQPL